MSDLVTNLSRLRYRLTVGVKAVVRRILPPAVWNSIRATVGRRDAYSKVGAGFAREWRRARQARGSARRFGDMPGGVNLIGYLGAAKGIGEAARNNLIAMQAASIPVSAIDYEVGVAPLLQTEARSNSAAGNSFRFNANLIHVHPPQLPYLWGKYHPSELVDRYSIAVWYWELPEFPDEWVSAFDLVDEVWAASQFIYSSVSARASVPVVKIPPCVAPSCDPRLKRSHYNLPEGRFLFLCAYDVLSVQQRKNPAGAIEAFRRAFPENDPSVGLVIKVTNAVENPAEIRRLRAELSACSNCFLLDDILDRVGMHSLINVTDAYVSLHRSEGFGLVGAESMYLGKPVVMTRWSGNVDYMTEDNSCGVDYRLVPVGEGAEPYQPSSLWAEPDVDQAAEYMRRLVKDRAYYGSLSREGARTIREQHSPRHVGELIRQRLHQIDLL